MPATWFAVVNTLVDTGATTSPLPIVPRLTVIVFEPDNAVTGRTTTVAAAAGPVTVLQVKVTVLGVTVKVFDCAHAGAAAISANTSPPNPHCVLCPIMILEFLFL